MKKYLSEMKSGDLYRGETGTPYKFLGKINNPWTGRITCYVVMELYSRQILELQINNAFTMEENRG